MDTSDIREAASLGGETLRLKNYNRQLASLRKQTPFGQTPSRRRISLNSPLQENADPQKIAFLLHKQWTLYSLTPMYRFSHDNFKEYSRLLNAFIAAEKQKGVAVEVGKELNFRVTFSALLGMKGTQRDPGAFLVQILSKFQTSSKPAEDRVVWTGWFCCTSGDSLLESITEDFTCLPLFLANGAESNTAIVGTWFQRTFDCNFSRLKISALNLSWMAALWSASSLDHHMVPLEFLWSVPCSPHSLDISYSIHPDDAQALWNHVHKTLEEITQEEVDLFIDCLCSHFHRHFKIHLTATRLVRVSTAIASAHTDGKIKILNSKYLTGVLALLTELAIAEIQ
ncbi:centromere protein L [Ornithorhynchus anatinus]|uniref:Centromere protein L n=1 Tax=Ornithorhynchus anatinus TaxID=9258 RepID=F6QG26_ORNAN|nr:centromere protein L [Ornithorhynchus anatinus]XP_028937203.1 centromere protein L [Ornithorhynchus anatinus]XP_028937204.1 centromere protein L [Ornithorhynchus anatinus]